MCSLLRSSGSLGFEWSYSGAPSCRRVNCFLRRFNRAPQRFALADWCSRGFTLGLLNIAGFIRIRVGSLVLCSNPRCSFVLACVYSGALGIVGFIREYTRAHLRVVGFIRVCISSLGRAYESSGSFGIAHVNSCAPRRRRIHSVSLGFTRTCLGVVAFIWVRMGSLVSDQVSSGSFKFSGVHLRAPKVRRVHSDSRVFTRALLKVARFIRVRVGLLGRV